MERTNNKKRIAIWGAGLYGSRFSVKLGRDCFDLFIDKNPKLTYHLNHPVVTPDSISDDEWSNLYIYIPFNYYKEISDFLNKKGLIEEQDFATYNSRLEFDDYTANSDLERFKQEASNIGSWSDRAVIWGRYWIKKEYVDFFKAMMEKGANLAVVSEAIWMTSDEAGKLLGAPAITAPCFSDEESVVISPKKFEKYCDIDDNMLLNRAEHLGAIHEHRQTTESYEYTVKLLYEYILNAIEFLGVKTIIMTGSVMVHHVMLTHICQKKGLRVIYTHQGIIPGTLAFDTTGEIGKSVPTLYFNEFKKLPVSQSETEMASEVLEYLRDSGLSRKVQPKDRWREKAEEKLIKDRPIILCLGQNDIFSHMVPYDEESKEYYSPIFGSSEEALFYLAAICEKNRWNLLYKPHPMYADRTYVEKAPQNVIYIPYGNINEMIDYCDVAVTILSTVNYICLIRRKPIVMLGYNQTNGKGCTYEAYDKNRIEDCIKEALEKGYSDEQHKAFVRHVAQCLRYYLYDDLQHRKLEYGKKVPDSIEDFYELEREVGINGLFRTV